MSDEIKFLEKYAETLGLKDKSRLVFCARFDKNNFGIGNNALAEKLCSDVNNPSEALQYHLKKVLDKLPQVGISHKNVGRGRPKNQEEPWKEAYEWLWDKPYSDYLEKYGTKPPIALDELCRESSRRSYRHLTISKNPLMAEIGLTADQSNVVSLEIVERKQISKKREDIQSSEQGSSFYQPTENEQGEKFSTTDRFLDEVIRDRKTNKSQGMRIAITGEAGAGKTTLLQSIGIYLERLNKELVPIWISLKQVTKSIDAYLVDEYLREITGTLPNLPIPSEYSESLNNLLKSGQVVLLLDGADESTERNILGNLGEQLTKPVFNMVQVVLTCRLNTWDTQWQSSFDVYRIIPFTYPVQVESFIDRFSWGDGENLAGDLKKVLKDKSKSRLVDMVTNPLRLALLCYLWKNGQQSLPDTRAELYRSMLEAFYRQKELEFGSPSKDLENALSQLALSAFNKEEYRYLLSESDVSKLLGSLNDKDSLFWQATKQFGLLNQVGKSSINPNENTYAFYHASFQEYFAALAVSHLDSIDSNYFLPIEHFNNSTPVKGKDYRIFASHWKEVILFWISRSNVEFKIKEKFIYRLMCFHDDCGGFYGFRALCLATECLSEFKQIELEQIEHLNLLLNLITSYAFILGSDDFSNLYNSNFAEASKLILKNLKISELSEKLENRISKINLLKSQSPSDKSKANLEIAKILISISPSNQTAFNTLIKLIENSKHNYTYITCDAIRTISKSTYEFSIYPDKTVLFLVKLLNNNKYSYALMDIFKSLGDACKYENFNSVKNSIIDFLNKKEELDNLEIIQSLKILIVVKEHFQIIDIEDILLGYLNKLLKTHDKNEKILSELILITEQLNNISLLVSNLEELMSNSSDDLSLKISECLIDFDCKNEKAIEYFMNHFSLPQNTKSLVKVANDNKDIQKHLIEWVLESSDLGCKFDILKVLIKTDYSKGVINNILLDTIKKANLSENQWIILETTEILTELNLSIPEDIIKTLRKIVNNSQDKRMIYGAIHCLLYSHNDNIVEINKLLTDFENNKFIFDLDMLINDLTRINLGKHKDKVIKSIENIINLYSETYFRRKLYSYSSINNLKGLNIEEYTFNLRLIVDRLFKIDGKNLTALEFLLNLIKHFCDDIIFQRKDYFERLEYAGDINFKRTGDLERLEYDFYITIEFINRYTDKSNLFRIVLNFRENNYLYPEFHKLIWHCAQNMSYPDFYEAWHSQPTSTHPEIADTIPSNNTSKIQTLESQFTDCEAIQKELYRNTDHPEIRCLVVDIRHLEQESDLNIIAEEIAIKIFDSLGCEIPEINRVSNLKRELINLKRILEVKKLAIALYGKNANEAIDQLCQNLAPIQTRLFIGEKTTQQLITKINAWLSEM